MSAIENSRLPATPFMLQDVHTGTTYYSGLTKREMFAMAVMQGLLANSTLATLDDFNSGAVCRRAVQEADALLAELDK